MADFERHRRSSLAELLLICVENLMIKRSGDFVDRFGKIRIGTGSQTGHPNLIVAFFALQRRRRWRERRSLHGLDGGTVGGTQAAALHHAYVGHKPVAQSEFDPCAALEVQRRSRRRNTECGLHRRRQFDVVGEGRIHAGRGRGDHLGWRLGRCECGRRGGNCWRREWYWATFRSRYPPHAHRPNHKRVILPPPIACACAHPSTHSKSDTSIRLRAVRLLLACPHQNTLLKYSQVILTRRLTVRSDLVYCKICEWLYGRTASSFMPKIYTSPVLVSSPAGSPPLIM